MNSRLKNILIIILCLIPILYLNWFVIGKTFRGTDDANIYFVYMKNIFNGNGFVYNINGENVEGFTSLLWTIIGVLGNFLPIEIYFTLLFVNIFILVFILSEILQYFDKNFDSKYKDLYKIFLLGFIFFTPGFIVWNVFSLLETGLWMSLIALVSINILNDKSQNRFNLLIFLLVFTRPEALFIGVFFILYKNIINKYYSCQKINVNGLFLSSIIFICSLLILHFWRYYYFDSLFPNTYYAKVTGTFIEKLNQGVRYDLLFFKENIFYSLLFIISIICLFFLKSKHFNRKFIFLILFTIITFLIPMIVGGDHFGNYRFFQPYIPIYLLLFYTIFFQVLIKDLNRLKYIFFFFFFSLVSAKRNFFNVFVLQYEFRSRIGFEITEDYRNKSILLNQFFDDYNKYPVIGVFAAGSSAYYYRGITLDLLGLNNVRMARAPKNPNGLKDHASFNKNVFFIQKPDILNIRLEILKKENSIKINDTIFFTDFERLTLDSIEFDKSFRQQYKNSIICNKKNNLILKAYIRKALLNKIVENNNYKLLN